MSKSIRNWLVVAISLIVVGLIIFATFFLCALGKNGWDFRKMTMGDCETKTHQITENFSSISISTDTADIVLCISENEDQKVEYLDKERFSYSIEVQDDILCINGIDNRKWYERLWDFGNDRITIYLSQVEYSSLKIRTDTGDITIPQFSFDNLEIEGSTGVVNSSAKIKENAKITFSTGDISLQNLNANSCKITTSTGDVKVTNSSVDVFEISCSTGNTYLENITSKNFSSTANTGDITLKNLVAIEEIYLERTTGDIHFYKCDASEIVCKTDTGDVTGTLLSEKDFTTHTSTGDVKVPDTHTGGKCEISTTTGDIKISIE